MHDAGCLCGAVRWAIDGPLEWMVHCHCSRCRKAHGSAFATWGIGPAASFRLHGAEHRSRWESSPRSFRCFCKYCGSVVPDDPSGEQAIVPAGSFTDDPGIRPAAHIFVASKAPWYELQDELPRFDAWPPGIDAPVLADRAPRDPPGAPRGSCLCGEVAYAVTAPPQRSVHCHCSRCRRARSAAFGSMLFAPVRTPAARNCSHVHAAGIAALQLFFLPPCAQGCTPTSGRHQRDPDGFARRRPACGRRLTFSSAPGARYEITDDLPQYASTSNAGPVRPALPVHAAAVRRTASPPGSAAAAAPALGLPAAAAESGNIRRQCS